jgi:putative flippase GtrA
MRQMLSSDIVRRYSYFVAIAGMATLLHIFVLWVLVEALNITPGLGNVFAFVVSFLFNYEGQRLHTFSIAQPVSIDLAIGLLINFSMNQTLYLFFLWLLPWNYLICLLFTVAISSPVSFFLVYYRTKKHHQPKKP